jgi:hypothetical protein
MQMNSDIATSQLNSKSSSQVCLEDHRLLIDRAIDKLKGEIREKDAVQIKPLAVN